MIFDENIQIRQIFTKIREVHFLNFCQMLGLVFDVGYLTLQPDPNVMPHILYYVKVRWLRGPCHTFNIVFLFPQFCLPRSMNRGIVVWEQILIRWEMASNDGQ
jgi:hypothetical protein